jgi:hypothetical protein
MPLSTERIEEQRESDVVNSGAETGLARSGFTFQEREVDEHPELVNLAKYMDPADLQLIADQCMEEYEADEKSRTEWLTMQSQWIDLYHGKLARLNPPWEGASDDHLPILAEGCAQFHARAYKAFFGNFDFVSALPVGSVREEDKARAERVGKYLSWQLGVRDKQYRRRKDRLLKALPLHGSFFTKTYRDNVARRIVVENVSPLDMVVNYTHTGIDIEDLERKTQVLWVPMRLVRFYASEAANQYFISVPEESRLGAVENTARERLDQIQGVRPNAIERRPPAKLLEMHRYLDLDGDGIEEPYIVILDATARKVLRIAIRWSWDAWLRQNYKQPLEYFTHYVYIENPDGFYGFGQGHLTGDLNIACDKLLRQIIDAATIQNARPGFTTQQTGLKSGSIPVQPGLITKLNTSVNLRESLLFLDHPGPSEAMIRMMQLMTARADRMNMVTDMLTGQPEKVYQTGATNALIEQGLSVFSAVQIRVHAALEQELAKIARLNGIYLDEKQYFVFNDGVNEREYAVMRADFADDLQVRPAFDPNQLTERERRAQAGVEYEVGLKNPLIARSPKHVEALTRRFYEAMGAKDLDEIVPSADEIAAQAAPQVEAMQARERVGAQASLLAQQADMAAKAEELRLAERKVANEERKTMIDAAEVALKEEQMQADRAAAQFEAAIRSSLNNARP